MDLEEYWQENKRFLAQVGIGLVVFLVGLGVIGATVGDAKRAADSDVAVAERKLKQPYYGANERSLAQEDHDALVASIEALRSQVAFVPRPEFRSADASDLDTNHYLDVASRVRAELMPLASRRNVDLEPTLGLPEQSPTRADEIERYLDALDVIERVVRAAIEVRVAKVDSIKVRLDPGLRGRKGTGTIERSRIAFEIHGDDLALQRLIASTQEAAPQSLVLDEVIMRRSRQDPELVVLELGVLIARVNARITDDEEDSL
ncbi:hypothetical protein Pla163_09840 [Planctomycetes bacterium Pla163]|uniref:Uncharacterized protein n=1 Tax=Rohdeia mirabilis TaxID=2528008 RepID=A0A518CXC3_9BACT|nr:hypothetical protein Pla163_09840 [Planctomycetes bacterium Pla163]